MSARESGTDKGTRASVGAFGLSVIIHATALLLVGGYVIFEGVVPQAPFSAVEGMVNPSMEEAVLPEPQDVTEMPEVPAVTQDIVTEAVQTSEGDATSSDILVSTAPSLTFNLPPAVGAPTPMPTLGTGGGGTSRTGEAPAAPSTAKVMRSLFGSNVAATNALVGTFYDVGRDRSGKPRGRDAVAGFAANLADQIVKERGSPRVFREVHAAPVKLFATQFVFPRAATAQAYAAFGEKPTNDYPAFWVHYTAKVSPPKDGRYRFSAWGDDYVIVLVDGKPSVIADNMVFAGNPARGKVKSTKSRFDWESPVDLIPLQWNQFARYTLGDWIDWKKGDFRQVDIFIGDAYGQFVALVGVEEEGKEYGKTSQGVPILPPFRVDRGRIDREEYKGLFNEGVDFDAKEGPVFQVQGS